MLKNLEKVYRGKRVFVTGHTGFKGAWLVKILSMLGAEVKGYALAPLHDNDLYYLLDGAKISESVIADIRDRDKMKQELVSFAPDFVFHLAAQPLVRLSYEIPYETFEVNALGTASVLDAVLALEKKCKVVLITTDKVYHNNEWEYPYRESDRLGGYDPYSASKACTELVIDSYRNSFFNPARYATHQKSLVVGRAGNVIGGGDWAKDRLLPDIAKALGNGKKVVVRNPASVRPWQHVMEPLSGYLLLGSKLADGPATLSPAFNLGPYADDALPVGEMVRNAIACWGKGEFELQQQASALHEAGLLKLDISKAISELGWKPKLNAREAISLTIDWYKTYFNNPEQIVAFTESQIISYFQ